VSLDLAVLTIFLRAFKAGSLLSIFRLDYFYFCQKYYWYFSRLFTMFGASAVIPPNQLVG